MDIVSVPHTANEALKKMCNCKYILEHKERKSGKCQECGWFSHGWFSPIKFKGVCGRVRSSKYNGMRLYCMAPKYKGVVCSYHYAVYKRKNPWV